MDEYQTTILYNFSKENINNQDTIKTTIETKIYVKAEDLKELKQNIIKYENKTKDMTKEEETEFYDNIVSNVEDILISEDFNTTSLDNGEDQVIQTEKMTITLTTSQNQKNNTNNNISTIDLGGCEVELRSHYHLTNNEILYIRKIDVIQEGMNIPKIEYSVYYKSSGKNLEKLNLSVCENSKLFLSVPVAISENIDKLNSSSDYYNDKCYKSTSDSGTDISLKDRQKEFVEGNKTVCQEECDFSDYDKDNQKANCSCKVKEAANTYADMNINKSKLYENFEDINNKKEISNLGVTSCNVFGDKENIESNTGFFLLIIILAIFIIIFILFCTRGYNSLENKIDQVIHKKFSNKAKKANNNNNKTNNNIIKYANNNHFNNKIKQLSKKESKVINKRGRNSSLKEVQKSNHQKHSKGYKKQKSKNDLKTMARNNVLNRISIQNNRNNNRNRHSSSIFQNKINSINNQNNKPDTDYEFNWLSYREALRFDKRSNCEYYCSLIKSKQLFIFTFCSINDYNSGIVKKFMLFLSFALHYTVNALFFTESTMHQIYEDEGKFNFEYQYPKILLSAMISTFVLRIMLQVLVLTDKDILEVKRKETKDLAIKMKAKKLKCMKIKFALFFIVNFILLTLFWYYLTCFNAIYQNTQVYLIKNTFISFAFSLFYPFIINIFPTMIRKCSLNSEQKDQEYFYKVSQLIQLI